MYGLWLYKELRTEYGFAKVEVFRKGYTASAIEIGALVGNSLNLALENLDTITAPIGKSVCSFSIYDTDQVEYDDLFTPDATAYKVVVSTKLDGGNYTTRWSGYVTPDFFAENLSYRTPISISARDNIGYLNDVDFDLDVATITVRELIQAAFSRIAEDYPMSLVFETQKQTAEGILAIDATISTALLREKSWYEAIETILHDLGMQMRWVDNNTIAVFDISQLGEKFGLQRFNFIDKSGYREILPAWRELSQKQDYGLRENFFEGWIKNNALTFVKSQSVKLPIPIGQAGAGSSATMKYYAPNNWGVAGNTYTINTEDFAYLGAYGQASTPFGKRIYFTGVDKADTTISQNYMSWRQNVYKSNDRMQITFKAFNSLLGTSYSSPDTLLAYNPAERFLGINLGLTTGDYIQLGLKVNLFLHVGTKTYIMRETWEEISGAETSSLYFVLDKMGDISEGDNMPKEQEISIGIGNIPASGQLELRIYGFTLEDKKNLQEDAKLATYDWLRMVSYIDDVTYSYADSNKNTGVVSGVEIASLHNIKASEDYSFGQITLFSGGINAYAGGLYKANGDELVGFRRDASSTTYPLLELVGREIIHFNKKNYTRLSGTAKNLSAEPLMFNKLLVYKGKNYLPYACTLDVISNTMNITTMQEVEPYTTQSFVEIKSELVTGGGATISGGNNTALQYSAEVGNAKRISELNNASESEKKESYIVVDNASWNESKKVPLSEMEGLDEAQVEAYLAENKYAKQSWVESITKPIVNNVASIAGRVDVAEATIKTHTDSIAKIVTDIAANATAININAKAIAAIDNRVDALEALGFVLKDGYIYTEKTIVSKGEIISGRRASGSSSDVTGGVSQVTAQMIVDALGYVPYSSQNPSGYITSSALNGYAKTSDIPSLSGYATQAWVEGKKYLTAHQDISHLLSKTDAANTYQPKGNYLTSVSWSDVSGKPSFATVATSGKYSDLSGLPTIPTNNNQLTNGAGYITSAALNGYATQSWVDSNFLSKSGGTMVSGAGIYSPLDLVYATVAFNSDHNAFGSPNVPTKIRSSSNPVYTNGSVEYSLLHSGNYSSYALPLSGGTMSGVITMPVNYQIQWGDSSRMIYGSTATIKVYAPSGLFINDNLVVHSGNIGSYNAGSATKLQTARTIWGQSFDGSANVSGDLNLNVSKIYWHQDSKNYCIYSYYDGSTTYLNIKDYGNIRFHTSVTERMRITNGGNVLIGTTTDSGYKLDVNGSASFVGNRVIIPTNGDRITFNAASGYSMGILVMNSGNTYIEAPLASNSSSAAQTPILIGWRNGVYPFYIAPSGNILMGTTADSGDKLRINGAVRANGHIRLDRYHGASEYLQLEAEDVNINYRAYDTDGWCSHNFFSNDYKLVMFNGYAKSVEINGNLTATGEVISSRRASSSDRRLKNNITCLDTADCLAMVRQIRPAEWDWKDNGKHSMGFIAQDVEHLMPYAVTKIKDEVLGQRLNLQYDQFFAPVVGAIQCLDIKVENHETRLKRLETENVELKNRLSKYETVWQ